MSNDNDAADAILGFLLLRDGHAVPLAGITPDQIKAGAKHRVPNPEAEPLRHKQTLNAIVDRVGFRGDYGDFKHRGWRTFQAFLKQHRCTHQAGLFPSDHGGCIDLLFRPTFGPTRRQLADRIFESTEPPPTRVFLGFGIDWPAWDRGDGFNAPSDAISAVPGDQATAKDRAQRLFKRRHDLRGHWGFIDDALIAGPVERLKPKTYFTGEVTEKERQRSYTKSAKAIRAFRAVFDPGQEGWVDVLPFNERLVVLRAHDGSWDLLWRAYRAGEPPQPSDTSSWGDLESVDVPSALKDQGDLQRAFHMRQEVWEELEAHEAEQAFYDRGGTAAERRLTSTEDVRIAWLQEQERLPTPTPQPSENGIPPGFTVVELSGQRLAVSELVDVGSFRHMLAETGFLERRSALCEPWDRANDGSPDNAPVGATWTDAQAYCAWLERKLGLALRLPTKAELREVRPFISEQYANKAGFDFWWENHRPRPLREKDGDGVERQRQLPEAVAWSEPRFSDPEPGYTGDHLGRKLGAKRWIKDFPPRAPWRQDLPWAEYMGLQFIDAWDAYEWCQETKWISGRFWEGQIGMRSWGAYKNVKVGFRLVLELGE